MYIKFLFDRIIEMYNMLLLMGVLTLLLASCETEYIPVGPDDELTTLTCAEGNFNLALRFANFGEAEAEPSVRSVEAAASARNMEPETNVIRVKDDLFIYATLAVDPVNKAPAVTTRKFNAGAKIRVVVYREDPGQVYTYVYDTLYYVNSSGVLIRDGSTNKINLPAATYKLIAYSFNNTTTAPSNYNTTISNIDPVNDVIWGESAPKPVSEGGVTEIPISMNHKLSQVSLVATTGLNGPPITAFSGVTMPGYTVNLTTLTGALAKNTAISQPFTFTIPGSSPDTVKSNTRTVYTGTPGDMPTVIQIGSLTVRDTTITDIPATFAKSLQSGYSYTMTMQIGDSPNLTDNIPSGFLPYVGAFWKKDQTGERLIRMPRMPLGEIDGVWTAHVIEGKDWIELDKVASSDPNIWTDFAALGNNTGFDNTYKLSTTASSFVSGMVRASVSPGFQSGDDQIYFRIGAKSQYTPTTDKPARYGIVLLTYANNQRRHRIWVRQGEGADFLMRNIDLVNTGGLTERTATRKFSPYNLTANAMDAAVSVNGALLDPPMQNDPPALFTKYPTQAGAFFQWANNDYTRYAWNPLSAGITGSSTLWSGYSASYWAVGTPRLSDNHETCPPGFRRPNDGFTDASVAIPLSTANMNLSEIRQSLYAQPQTDDGGTAANSTWGYYADGFFDRLPITASPNNITMNSAVSTGNNNVAYIGRIFYNPNNKASLFFPAAGNRTNTNGTLAYAGSRGEYWSSSSASAAEGWSLYLDNLLAAQHNETRSYGNSIRCVERLNPTTLCLFNSTQGKEFWVSFGKNYTFNSPRLELRVSSAISTTITLTFTEGGFTATYPVIAGDVLQIDLSAVPGIYNMRDTLYDMRDSVYLNIATESSNVSPKTLKLTSPDPVSVYAFNTGSATTDATALLPVTAWGKEYYRITYPPTTSYSFMDFEMIIANQNNTNIYEAGSAIPLATLNAGQVYYNLEPADRTGRHILADKPVAYFTHSQGSQVPSGRSYIDILFEQLAPVSQWGTRFLVPNAPQGNNNMNNLIRIVASQPNTMITYTGASYTAGSGVTPIPPSGGILDAGQWIELLINRSNPTTDACFIDADKPVGVAAYMTGSKDANSNNGGGDPSICWIPAVDKQMVQEEIIAPFMFLPGTDGTHLDELGQNLHYMIIISPTATANQTTVNGMQLSTGWVDDASGFSHYIWYFTSPTDDINTGDMNNSFHIVNPNGIIVLGAGVGVNESYYYNAGSGTCVVNEN